MNIRSAVVSIIFICFLVVRVDIANSALTKDGLYTFWLIFYNNLHPKEEDSEEHKNSAERWAEHGSQNYEGFSKERVSQALVRRTTAMIEKEVLDCTARENLITSTGLALEKMVQSI